MYSKTLAVIFISATFTAGSGIFSSKADQEVVARVPQTMFLHNVSGITLPAGFSRKPAPVNSFEYYLRNIPLKGNNTVYLYNGQQKINQKAQFAVLDITVGKKDLQQCADAVIRLRAEFLFGQKRYADLVFKDNAGTAYRFTPPYTYENFYKFLERVFGRCGTASLSKQLRPVSMHELSAGDVLVRGGFPGHAVIVMDAAYNAKGETIYLLAQSYMPAQDIHILKNPASNLGSPWYLAGDDQLIQTPEYIFRKNELKRW